MTKTTSASDGQEPEDSRAVSRRDIFGALGALGGAAVLAGCAADVSDSGTGTLIQSIETVDGGHTVRDHTNGFKAAIDTIGTGEATLIIDGSVNVTADVIVPVNITLRFQDGGQLIVDATYTLTLRCSIEAVPDPSVPLFDVSASGAVASPRSPGVKFYANWWSDDSGGAVDFGQQWNNMVVDANRGASADSPRVYAAAGRKTVKTTMDITGFRNGLTLEFTGSQLTVDLTSDDIGIEFTESTELTVKDLYLISNGGAKVGILLARDNAINRSSGKHHFLNLKVLGYWTLAALYNISSENNLFVGGRLGNQYPAVGTKGRYVAVFTSYRLNDDPNGVAPPEFATKFTDPMVEKDQSCVGQMMVGVRVMGKVTDGSIYIANFSKMTFTDMYIASRGLPGGDSPHVVLNSTAGTGKKGGWGVNGISFDRLYTHGNGFDDNDSNANPVSAIALIGHINNEFVGIQLSSRNLACTTNAINVGAVTLEHCHLSYPDGNALLCHEDAKLHDCEIDVRGTINVTLGAFFSGRIWMGDPASNLTEATVMEGIVVGAETRIFNNAEVTGEMTVGEHVHMGDLKSVRWGGAKVRGASTAGKNHISLVDRSNAVVATVRSGHFYIPALSHLTWAARQTAPAVSPGEAALWVDLNGNLQVVSRVGSTVHSGTLFTV